MQLLKQARRKYKHLGLRALLDTPPRSIAIYLLLHHVIGTIGREELRLLSEEDGGLWDYGSDETIEIRDRSGHPVPDPFEPIAGTYRTDRPFVCELSGYTLVGRPAPVAVSPDGRIVLESCKNNTTEAMNRLRQRVSSDGWTRAVSRFRGDEDTSDTSYDLLFPMVKQPDFSYYHWLTEYLPKIRGLEEYERRTGESPVVLLEPDPPGWLLEQLQLVGVPLDRCVEWNVETAHVNRLVLTTHREKSRGEFFNPSTEDYEWVRERVLSSIEGMEIDDEQLSDRVYISRRNTDDRRVTNEEEVIDALSEMGFVSYELENMDVATQARLFSRADIVVGPHGAGSTNIVFSDGSATLIDLINERHLEPGPHLAYYYFAIAHQLDINYEYLPCAPDGRDMVVDLNELRETVEAVEQRSK